MKYSWPPTTAFTNVADGISAMGRNVEGYASGLAAHTSHPNQPMADSPPAEVEGGGKKGIYPNTDYHSSWYFWIPFDKLCAKDSFLISSQ